MKCPYCNQNHPDDYQFCPATGKKIELLKACTNQECLEYGKKNLPSDSLFCPKCGHKLEGDNTPTYVFNPRKSMSSLEDFKHGNIIVDGIILGRTPASELKKYPGGTIAEGIYAKGGLTTEDFDRFLEASEQNDPQMLSAMRDRVYEFMFYVHFHDCSNIPFLNELGIDKINLKEKEGENEMVEILERNGYVRIEPPVIRKEWEEKILMRGEKIAYDMLYFISKEPNAYGNYISLTCGESCPISIGVSWLRDWKLYYSCTTVI